MNRRQFQLGFAALMLGAMSLTAPALAQTKPLRVRMSGAAPLDPVLSAVPEVNRAVYEPLTAFNTKLDVVPAAAESWRASADGKSWQFKLRKGLVYSDGAPLNAKRFVDAIVRVIDPSSGSGFEVAWRAVDGASEWGEAFAAASDESEKDEAKKKAAQDAATAAEARVRTNVRALTTAGQPCKDYKQTDCLTVEIKTTRPTPFIDRLVANARIVPVRAEIIAKGPEWHTSAANHIGNGPYLISGSDLSTGFSLKTNPRYRLKLSKLPAFDFVVIEGPDKALEAFRKNEVDIVQMFDFSPTEYQAIFTTPELRKHLATRTSSCTYFVVYRTMLKPFEDVKVRQAFAYAFDRDATVTKDFNDGSVATRTLIPPGFPGYVQNETRYKRDLAKARETLAASTYGSAAKLPKILISYNEEFAPNKIERQRHADALREAFPGITVEIKGYSRAEHGKARNDPASGVNMYMTAWCGDTTDPSDFLSQSFGPGGAVAAWTGYSDAKFDALAIEADSDMNPASRAKKNAALQDMLIDQQPVTPLANFSTNFLARGLRDIRMSPLDGLPGEFERASWVAQPGATP
jgi:oligopeptide transport system substrate-binding protein